ncbi:hypothetical protein GOARA_008_00050 [Gordonia araii NBRC 100433]|uniref:Tat pathway signal sequence domain protein n=1 Tax=Gordonia araii NBRC 100433 TaxID=1073574 RepID=G7GXI0_9ACTN|nr:hypothetical protein [Gordonia araii]NNG98254.1 hypothetical protein [Gordonia araii NBRC 100433]GAB08305.1 hypothetical protein GOARA_008_00050 [Gordonia araii NBRC 100433]
MKKAFSALAVSTVAAATGIGLIAAPAASAQPQGRVSFAVDGHRLVATATNLPWGTKTCSLYRGVRNRGPATGSLGGGGMMPVAERRSTQRTVRVTSRPVRAGNYHVRLFCLGPNMGGTRRIVADREGMIRVTVRPQVAPPVAPPFGPQNDRPGQRPPAR